MLTTTLDKILRADPCHRGWQQLLASLPADADFDAELSLVKILDSNGIYDTMWACIHAHDAARFFAWTNYMRTYSVVLSQHEHDIKMYGPTLRTFYVNKEVFMRKFLEYLNGTN